MVEILAGHQVGREGQCLTIQEDSCQEQLASVVIEKISKGIYGGSTQEVSRNSSRDVAVTGESSSGGRSLPANVLGNVLEEPVLVKKNLVCFQIQEIVFHFSILLQRLLQYLVQQNGESKIE